jgi:hypothetical protein
VSLLVTILPLVASTQNANALPLVSVDGRLTGQNLQFAVTGNKEMWKYLLSFMITLLSITACKGQTTSSPASTPISPPSLDIHFPQLDRPLGNTDSLVRGELTLENKCLRVSKAKTLLGDSFLLIWEPNFAIRKEQGVVQVIDSNTGEVLASVGDYVEVGGGVAPANIEQYLREPLPPDCPGPYWLAGETLKKIDSP